MAGNNYKLLLQADLDSKMLEARLRLLSNKSEFLLKVKLQENDFTKKLEQEIERIKEKASSIAIAISKSIKKTGIKPKPFLIPAFNEVMKGFNTRVINALNRVLR